MKYIQNLASYHLSYTVCPFRFCKTYIFQQVEIKNSHFSCKDEKKLTNKDKNNRSWTLFQYVYSENTCQKLMIHVYDKQMIKE